MTFLGLSYKASEFLSTIKAKRGTKTFNKEVCRAQCKVHFCYPLMPKINAKLFKFHAKSLTSNHSPWQATIVPHQL